MKLKYLILTFFLISTMQSYSQEVIKLYSNKASGTAQPTTEEKEIKDGKTGLRTVYNVTEPTMTVYKPDPSKTNGAAVIVCPGGAFHVLDIDNEGTRVAKWFAEQGFTAFVLKYRLLRLNPENPFAGLAEESKDMARFSLKMNKDVPLAIEDGKAAMAYIRSHASKFNIDQKKIGVIGFSAGGTIAASLALADQKESSPAFAATIYPYLLPLENLEAPSFAPPLFISVAENDTYGFDEGCLNLYKTWKKAKKNVDLHIYSKGSHGFGTKKQGLPVDQWMLPLSNWLSWLGY